ncbi:MAG TPA: cation-transporting P-type ATPase [Halobacteriales archaeon]|nr:cation-transporting P-type ATPase [Halobacteriales archaeon]
MDWHASEVQEVFSAVDADEAGLASDEADARLDESGPNELRHEEGPSPLSILASQFNDALIYLLVLAAVLSVAVGLLPGQSPEYTEAGLILAILLANGVFGFVQDYQAEQAIQSLRELATPDATVLRDGEVRTVDSRAVVPGDVVVLEQGDAVPADARLFSATAMAADESTLTGESAAVEKGVEPAPADAPLAERPSMVYANTSVVAGRGRAVVVETGMDTEVGAIAGQLAAAEDTETPFQAEVDRLGRRIGLGVMALIVVVAAAQLLATAAGAVTVVLVAVTLAVAAVPEGLPAVVTLTLALGSRKLLGRNALVRSLPVVESLGAVDVIVTDKTGTLTENTMTVRRIAAGGDTYEVTGTGTDSDGSFSRGRVEDGDDGEEEDVDARGGERIDPEEHSALSRLLVAGAVCNNAEATDDGYRGDPTEVAVVVAAAKAGIEPDGERLREVPFSSARKRMTVVVEGDGAGGRIRGGDATDGPTAYVKGAPEVVLDRCARIVEDGEVVELTEERREAVLSRNREFAAGALRVLGFAEKRGVDPDADPDELESGLVFLGLQGMIDPPRSEVPGAVADCRSAGIRAVMVTGDNVETAKAVGREVGFDTEGALSGNDVDRLSADELAETVESVDVFARVSPEHKVAILSALQGNGHTVAMTGDGVNDAPALRSADVGVAMGQRGTDVARAASDMVLLDDNFTTIRDAVEAGRGVFDNLRKFVNYLLSANAGEVAVVFLGVLVGAALFPETFAGQPEALILTPVMLLWINLVTDGLPALALGADPTAPDVMERPPRGRDEPVIGRRMTASILGIGAIMAVTGLAVFFYGLDQQGLLVAQTALFTFLVAVEIVRIQVIRSRFDHPIGSNRWLLAAVATSLALQLAVLYTPLAELFAVVPLGLDAWGWIGAGFVAFLALNLGMVWAYDRAFDER